MIEACHRRGCSEFAGTETSGSALPVLAGSRSAKARRQQRWRQRQATGQIVLTVTAPQDEIVEALITSGRLTVAQAFDGPTLVCALGDILDWSPQWARSANSVTRLRRPVPLCRTVAA